MSAYGAARVRAVRDERPCSSVSHNIHDHREQRGHAPKLAFPLALHRQLVPLMRRHLLVFRGGVGDVDRREHGGKISFHWA